MQSQIRNLLRSIYSLVEIQMKSGALATTMSRKNNPAATIHRNLTTYADVMCTQLWRDVMQLADAEIPEYKVLTTLPGIGEKLAVQLLALVDMDKTPSYAALWSYAGLSVCPDGQRYKGRKYNHDLRRVCYNISIHMIMSESRYTLDYYEAKLMYLERGWTPRRSHLAACRLVVKKFLRHAWYYRAVLHKMPLGERRLAVRSLNESYRYGWPKVDISEIENHQFEKIES
jgi:hypothetical protein